MSKKSNNTKVIQENNTVSGDMAGGDINKTTVNNFTQTSALRRRSQELKDLYVKDEGYRCFIDKLQKFLTPAESELMPRTLEEKLTTGKRTDLVQEGKILKERFSKKIHKNQFSEQAQELFAHILAQINSFFNSKVRPLIRQGNVSSEIDALIYDQLIKPIYDDVGDGPINIDTEDLKGMLYFLTGTCHLEWE